MVVSNMVYRTPIRGWFPYWATIFQVGWNHQQVTCKVTFFVSNDSSPPNAEDWQILGKSPKAAAGSRSKAYLFCRSSQAVVFFVFGKFPKNDESPSQMYIILDCIDIKKFRDLNIEKCNSVGTWWIWEGVSYVRFHRWQRMSVYLNMLYAHPSWLSDQAVLEAYRRRALDLHPDKPQGAWIGGLVRKDTTLQGSPKTTVTYLYITYLILVSPTKGLELIILWFSHGGIC